MHTLIVTRQWDYQQAIQRLLIAASHNYQKSCYISLNESYEVVIQMLQTAQVDANKFVIIDASGRVKEQQTISKTTYAIPVKDLFTVYLFMRNLIKQEGIELVLLDSLSTLITNYSQLPLKEMLTNLLLELGECDSSLVVFDEHAEHELITALNPLIGKSMMI